MAALVDTNVLVYAHDPRDPRKQRRAIELVGDLATRGELVVSVQVLNEFFVRATMAGKPPSMTPEQALATLADIGRAAHVLDMASSTTFRAVNGVLRHRLSFWDALIWAAALEHAIPVIYTESRRCGERPGFPTITPGMPNGRPDTPGGPWRALPCV